MGGDKTIFEILYGRKFSEAELSSQPCKMLLFECLIHDNEIEYSHMQKMSGKKEGQTLIVPGKSTAEIKEMIFDAQHPEYRNAVVTLLSTKEYLKIASASTNYYRNLFGENPEK